MVYLAEVLQRFNKERLKAKPRGYAEFFMLFVGWLNQSCLNLYQIVLQLMIVSLMSGPLASTAHYSQQ